MSWAPLRYAFTRPLRRYANVRKHAAEAWVHSPTLEGISPPAVYDPAELARVTGVERRTTLAFELSRVRGGRVTHAATRVHRIVNATLAGAHVYRGPSREQVAEGNVLAWVPRATEPTVPRAMMVGSVVASMYFGHWVTEELTAELLAAELGVPAYRAARQVVYPHEAAYRAATGLRVDCAERVRFGELLLIDDYGQNESKRRRYVRLREALRRGASPSAARGVFVRRGTSGEPRPLANEAEILEALVGEGFVAVQPEEDGLEALRDALHDAPLVVGVEGSQLIHAIMMMPERGRILVVQPPDRFNNVHKDYTDCLGMRYGFTVADPRPSGFHLPLERLYRAIERLERA